MYLVFIGNRHLGYNRKHAEFCAIMIDKIISSYVERYNSLLNISSISCDTAFGKGIRDYCEEHGIKFAEFVVYFNGPRDKTEYEKAYKARHAALVDMGEEFVVVNSSRQMTLLDLMYRVRLSKKPYTFYNDKGTIVEQVCASTQEEAV